MVGLANWASQSGMQAGDTPWLMQGANEAVNKGVGNLKDGISGLYSQLQDNNSNATMTNLLGGAHSFQDIQDRLASSPMSYANLTPEGRKSMFDLMQGYDAHDMTNANVKQATANTNLLNQEYDHNPALWADQHNESGARVKEAIAAANASGASAAFNMAQLKAQQYDFLRRQQSDQASDAGKDIAAKSLNPSGQGLFGIPTQQTGTFVPPTGANPVFAGGTTGLVSGGGENYGGTAIPAPTPKSLPGYSNEQASDLANRVMKGTPKQVPNLQIPGTEQKPSLLSSALQQPMVEAIQQQQQHDQQHQYQQQVIQELTNPKTPANLAMTTPLGRRVMALRQFQQQHPDLVHAMRPEDQQLLAAASDPTALAQYWDNHPDDTALDKALPGENSKDRELVSSIKGDRDRINGALIPVQNVHNSLKDTLIGNYDKDEDFQKKYTIDNDLMNQGHLVYPHNPTAARIYALLASGGKQAGIVDRTQMRDYVNQEAQNHGINFPTEQNGHVTMSDKSTYSDLMAKQAEYSRAMDSYTNLRSKLIQANEYYQKFGTLNGLPMNEIDKHIINAVIGQGSMQDMMRALIQKGHDISLALQNNRTSIRDRDGLGISGAQLASGKVHLEQSRRFEKPTGGFWSRVTGMRTAAVSQGGQ